MATIETRISAAHPRHGVLKALEGLGAGITMTLALLARGGERRAEAAGREMDRLQRLDDAELARLGLSRETITITVMQRHFPMI